MGGEGFLLLNSRRVHQRKTNYLLEKSHCNFSSKMLDKISGKDFKYCNVESYPVITETIAIIIQIIRTLLRGSKTAFLLF